MEINPIVPSDKKQQLTTSQIENFNNLLVRLLSHEPVQYVVGAAWFCGMKLAVSKDVLIPRPETEELVMIIAADVKMPSPAILDIGTGSGCIALGLKKMLPSAIVTAIDISEEALLIANKNSELQNLQVNFLPFDILNWQLNDRWSVTTFDIIVSNPPYIAASEITSLSENVTAFEPQLALFVPDDDKLLFYRYITSFAKKFLKPGGWLYFEIHQQEAENIMQLLLNQGYLKVQSFNDISGNKRFIKAIYAD